MVKTLHNFLAGCRRLPILTLAIALTVLPTFPAGADEPWQSRDVRMASHQGFFIEFCVPVTLGRELAVEVHTPHAVDFNIHFHIGNDTRFPVRKTVEGKSFFSIPVEWAGEYCLMMTNPEARPDAFVVAVRHRLRDAAIR